MTPRLTAYTAASLMLIASLISASLFAGDESLLPTPKKDLDVSGLRSLEGTQRIALPTLYIKLMTWGRMSPVPPPSSAGKKDRGGRPTLEIGMTVDAKVVRVIARELYDDLVAQLRAGGWQVLTFRELSSSTSLFRLAQEEVDPTMDSPVDTISPTKEKRRYIKAAPERMPVVKEPNGMAVFEKVAEEQKAPLLVATYVFEPVAFEAGQSTNPDSLPPLGERASLQLVYAGLEFINPRGGTGSVHTRAPVQLWANIGSLGLAPDNGPEMAYALPKKLAAEALKKKSLYLLRTDFEALRTCTLESGKEFNRAAVQSLLPALKK